MGIGWAGGDGGRCMGDAHHASLHENLNAVPDSQEHLVKHEEAVRPSGPTKTGINNQGRQNQGRIGQR